MLILGKDYREQINELTSFIDLGNVYGNSYLVSKAMEAGVYGKIFDWCIGVCKGIFNKGNGGGGTTNPNENDLV